MMTILTALTLWFMLSVAVALLFSGKGREG